MSIPIFILKQNQKQVLCSCWSPGLFDIKTQGISVAKWKSLKLSFRVINELPPASCRTVFDWRALDGLTYTFKLNIVTAFNFDEFVDQYIVIPKF